MFGPQYNLMPASFLLTEGNSCQNPIEAMYIIMEKAKKRKKERRMLERSNPKLNKGDLQLSTAAECGQLVSNRSKVSAEITG